jgi:hypothetical protein
MISDFKWKFWETDSGDRTMHYSFERKRQRVSNVWMKCTFSERRLLTGPVPMQHWWLRSEDAGLWRCGALPRYERWMGVCPPAQRHNELADKVLRVLFFQVVFGRGFDKVSASSLLDTGDHLPDYNTTHRHLHLMFLSGLRIWTLNWGKA